MNDMRSVFIGVLAIILGLIVIIFPLISVTTFSVLAGLGVIFLGIWFIFQAYKNWNKSLAAVVANLIIAFFAIAFGIVFIVNVQTLSFVVFLALYIVGFFLIISGLSALVSGSGIKERGVGVLGVVLGIVYMIIGAFVGNPFYLAIILGAFLIIAGIMEIFFETPELPFQPGEEKE